MTIATAYSTEGLGHLADSGLEPQTKCPVEEPEVVDDADDTVVTELLLLCVFAPPMANGVPESAETGMDPHMLWPAVAFTMMTTVGLGKTIVRGDVSIFKSCEVCFHCDEFQIHISLRQLLGVLPCQGEDIKLTLPRRGP